MSLIVSEQCRTCGPQQEEFHALILDAVPLDFLKQVDCVAVPALNRISAYSVDIASSNTIVRDGKNREGGDCNPPPLQSVCPAMSESPAEEQIQEGGVCFETLLPEASEDRYVICRFHL